MAAPAVPDTLAQRAAACTACHAPQDREMPQGFVPALAGKPAIYLKRQMLAFRDGRRRHAIMAGLMEFLSDDYLAALADHFATLPARRVPQPPAKLIAAEASRRGQALATAGDKARSLPACTACHGAELAGDGADIPGLPGLPRGYLVAQLGAWRAGLRQATAPDCMAQVARRLEEVEIAAIADWIANLPPPAEPRGKPAAASTSLPLRCGSVAAP
ncbi:c-type cytochrome [Rubrivivax sp. A210]|uniref:c-type cytochrome n=1 Tax=Rubrivivax sp. A210 TaxID=2772301 RepID=UPI001F301176|nr:c-type cytochrome [Rubrivivax sp. A210]